ncbi:hypothetical protein CFP65_6703 [Kitasatospora sp. MMS16-BH015]|uniref:thiol:disulfide interchange protein DsbA/DsbL n=1 Tax=Kitasatospora sp. MMS16-BH015 TaxID=2018025 RepID=UPI000CA2DBCF|nr:thiol:disulfide interchange protein DsbA/DsbL [Kitasatospora sp. MMS16-BH015]AUG81347.1 hypothetical protein CFP65_6703 [Kitasatospora sp. MMS16-BH015]
MKPLLRTAVLLAVTGSLLTGPTAMAAPRASAHYVSLEHPQPVRAGVKHEVLEFFWYDCTHSALLEQPLEDWADRHREDAVLRRVPAVWPGASNEAEQRAHARLYYALEQLGAADRLQAQVFQAVYHQHADLTTEDRAAAWAGRNGLDTERFRTAYRSPEVARAVQEAPELFTRYEVTELPTVVVQGRYRTSPSAAGGVDKIPGVLDTLVDQ